MAIRKQVIGKAGMTREKNAVTSGGTVDAEKRTSPLVHIKVSVLTGVLNHIDCLSGRSNGRIPQGRNIATRSVLHISDAAVVIGGVGNKPSPILDAINHVSWIGTVLWCVFARIGRTLKHVLALDVRLNELLPASAFTTASDVDGTRDAAFVIVLNILKSPQSNLLHVGLASSLAGVFTHLLEDGKENSGEDRYDGDDDEQFNQSEAAAASR